MIISICNFQIKLMPRNIAFVCFNLDKICSQFTTARKFLNHICVDNAHFFCGDASDTRGLLASAKDSLGDFCPDVVIIDPPRKGTTKELVDYLDSLGVPRIVYVSCNPDTLARDCAWFAQKGYEIGEVTPVDMFPGTGHVESVVCLTK